MRRLSLAAGAALLAAAAPSCATPPPRQGPQALQSIHVDANSWGTRLRGWTVDASGRGQFEQAPPGAGPGDGRIVRHAIAIGPSGFRQLAQALAPVEQLAQRPYSCRPAITDQVYGTVTFRRRGRDASLNYNLGCVGRRDRQLHATLAAADRLLDRLTGTPSAVQTHTPDHPEPAQ